MENPKHPKTQPEEMKRENCGPCFGKLVHQSSRGCNFGTRSPSDAHHTLLEISIRGIQRLSEKHWSMVPCFFWFSQKKRRLGPQNGSGSSGPEKLLKIVSCAETKKLKETVVGPQVD